MFLAQPDGDFPYKYFLAIPTMNYQIRRSSFKTKRLNKNLIVRLNKDEWLYWFSIKPTFELFRVQADRERVIHLFTGYKVYLKQSREKRPVGEMKKLLKPGYSTFEGLCQLLMRFYIKVLPDPRHIDNTEWFDRCMNAIIDRIYSQEFENGRVMNNVDIENLVYVVFSRLLNVFKSSETKKVVDLRNGHLSCEDYLYKYDSIELDEDMSLHLKNIPSLTYNGRTCSNIDLDVQTGPLRKFHDALTAKRCEK